MKKIVKEFQQYVEDHNTSKLKALDDMISLFKKQGKFKRAKQFEEIKKSFVKHYINIY